MKNVLKIIVFALSVFLTSVIFTPFVGAAFPSVEPWTIVGALALTFVVVSLFVKVPKNSLAFTSWTQQLLRDVIQDFSQRSGESGQQKFEMRTNDIGVMNAYYGMREMSLSQNDIAKIENLRVSTQAIDLYVYNKRAPGAGATRVRQGTGSSTVATVVPPFFTLIQEGLDLSFVNQSIRQYGSEGADKQRIIREAYLDHLRRELPQLFRNIYTRANAQFIADLDANKWVLTGTPDLGTIYTTYLGDAKNIPAGTAFTEIIQNMQIEAQQNNFLQLGRPTLIVGPTAMRIFNEYLARGENNSENFRQFIGWFDLVVDNGIVDAAGDLATMYLVAPGGLSGYSRTFPWESHPKAENGVVNTGEDQWTRLPIGGADTMIFSEAPSINLEAKFFTGYADNSATIDGNPDEGKIDIAENMSFVCQFGGLPAYDSNANIKPIIKYILKAV